MISERQVIDVTTDGSGDATVYSAQPLVGAILAITYIKPGSGGYANTADFTITLENTGQNVWTESNVTASKTVNTRVPAAKADGTASTITEVPVHAAYERLKIVVAQGGAAATGKFFVVLGG